MPVGCKFKFKTFTITGIWEVDQRVTHDDGKKESMIFLYEFTGNEYNGKVATSPPLSSGVYSGTYEVEGNQIVFRYSMGRGPYMKSTIYTGKIYTSIHVITGTLTGLVYMGEDVERTWTGNFIAGR
jgi:hypothetical protein